MPSLQQLLEAVGAVTKEFTPDNVTVIVDATFGHRIDASEKDDYDAKTSTGEIITPPAGVIGRGDAFILEVADRADAVVLSNDSFQEFHGKFDWLFTEGRLLGGKYVPGVGWIFLDRSPVRGPTSRKAVSEAKRKRRGSKKAASAPRKKAAPKSKSGSSRSGTSKSASKRTSATSGSGTKSAAKTQRKSGGKEPQPYNEPLPFIEFVGAHPVGSVVSGEVEQFSSHGAYVLVDGTRCYIPLKALGDPAPRSARDVLTMGETSDFVVEAIDTPRRGIDLTVSELSSGGAAAAPDDEPTPKAESAPPKASAAATPADGDQKLSVSQRRKLRAQQAAAAEEATSETSDPVRETMAAKKKASKKKASKKKAAPKKKAPAKRKAPARKAPAKRKAPARKKSAAKKAPAKKKSAAKKAPAKKKSAAKKAPAKKAAAKKKAPAKKAKKAAKRARKR